jgi:hypothetical protein
MNVGVEHCGRDTFGIGKLFTYISPLSATKELAQFVGPFITKKTRYKPNIPFGVLGYHAANNTLSPGQNHLKKKYAVTAVVCSLWPLTETGNATMPSRNGVNLCISRRPVARDRYSSALPLLAVPLAEVILFGVRRSRRICRPARDAAELSGG